MLQGKGFRTVGRVQVKADAGVHSLSEDGRRNQVLPKSEFTVFQKGALIKGSRIAVSHPNNHKNTNNIPEYIINDNRAPMLHLKSKNGSFTVGYSLERFSGHTGICRVLGSKKLPVVPYHLKLGDLVRIGSVGLVVCEINSSNSADTLEALTDDDFSEVKRKYLCASLSQESRSFSSKHEKKRQCDDDDDVHGGSSGADTSDEEFSSSEDATDALPHQCYICYDPETDPEDNPLVAPCKCKGDTKYVHLNCLQRWYNNEDGEGGQPKLCSVTNTDGLDICTICKSTYQTSVRMKNGRIISLLAKKLAPPYITFAVVTQHDTRSRSLALTNSRFQVSFASLHNRSNQFISIGRSTNNHMVLRYRTVSQLHAKLYYREGHFVLMDAGSSNGTMLFLNKSLPLPWNKQIHLKMGKTILSVRAKKKLTWGFRESNHQEEEESESKNRV